MIDQRHSVASAGFYSPRETLIQPAAVLSPPKSSSCQQSQSHPVPQLRPMPAYYLYSPFRLYENLDALRSFDESTGRRSLPTAIKAVRAKQAAVRSQSEWATQQYPSQTRLEPQLTWIDRLKNLVPACSPRRARSQPVPQHAPQRSTIGVCCFSRRPPATIAPQFQQDYRPGLKSPMGPTLVSPDQAMKIRTAPIGQLSAHRISTPPLAPPAYNEQFYKAVQELVPTVHKIQAPLTEAGGKTPVPSRFTSQKQWDSMRRDPHPPLGSWNEHLEHIPAVETETSRLACHDQNLTPQTEREIGTRSRNLRETQPQFAHESRLPHSTKQPPSAQARPVPQQVMQHHYPNQYYPRPPMTADHQKVSEYRPYTRIPPAHIVQTKQPSAMYYMTNLQRPIVPSPQAAEASHLPPAPDQVGQAPLDRQVSDKTAQESPEPVKDGSPSSKMSISPAQTSDSNSVPGPPARFESVAETAEELLQKHPSIQDSKNGPLVQRSVADKATPASVVRADRQIAAVAMAGLHDATVGKPVIKIDRRMFHLELPPHILRSLTEADRSKYTQVLENYRNLAAEVIHLGSRIDPTCIRFIRLMHPGLTSPSTIDPSGITRYVVPDPEEAIQAGSFGTVYMALIGAKKVAVKVPSQRALREDLIGTIDKLVHEARVLLRCGHHPSIVNFIGIHFESFDRLWLVMELADGLDFHALQYDKQFNLNPEARLSAIQSLAESLAYLHTTVGNKGSIVHRDVKPENILIIKGTKTVLCDFGNSEHSLDGTFSQLRGVTWFYAPPEALMLDPAPGFKSRNIPEAGPSWDLWSFGCVLMEMLGLPHPFSHFVDVNDAPDVIHRVFCDVIRKGEFKPRIPVSVQKPLLNIIAGALHPDWRRRITAKQVVSTINKKSEEILRNIVDLQVISSP
eukprot:Gregarina_sp_Poly_1__4761@NODE_253_length_10628_cov_50_063252_g221_i0_p2_GENE_NODE_253_length_10628_cov_50_063252_g221_i0NODE_253_length_10628_cov_50_063252_g221_i0_p2_ORF_typecomplete_len906_score129_84Pkinase/PF00069_25/4_9e43Pkinase_Tyr/PF07714_17/7_1e36Kinaselike/PF14531_6/2_2e09Kdo/PF06293_14/3_9e06Pkinase_fungal/PF17667_1/0_00015RIO1/PF01163_22/4e03RIO1/PF01163_22/8_9e02RIO1/PF01163_22/0_0047RIO1/PF01163_22/2e03WaaY/PF06176_11/0_0061APH/PF01636_23/1_2e03APH/PF01636_23/9_2e02APH/PF01636_23/